MNAFLFVLKKNHFFGISTTLIILRKNGTMNTKINCTISFARN